MTLKSFSQLQNPDGELNRIQSNVAVALNPITAVTFLDGQAIQGITITAGTPFLVTHGLGRPVEQWWVTDINANSVVWRSASTDEATVLTLNASANVTIDIWVS